MVSKPTDIKAEGRVWPEIPIAGEAFTASVRIENRFERPIQLTHVWALLPAELERAGPTEQALSPGDQSLQEQGKWRWLLYLFFPLRQIRRSYAEMSFFRSPNQFPMSAVEIGPDRSGTGQDPPQRVLQPQSSTVWNFPITTRGWVTASARRHKLDVSILYTLGDDKTPHSEVVPIQFDVRPPLRSVVIGAVFGACIGSLARELSGGDVTSDRFGLKLLLAVLLGGIGVIFLSRKTGVQPLPVSVEDFWGGLLVGFLVGYFGGTYFERLLPESISEVSPNSPLSQPGAAPATR